MSDDAVYRDTGAGTEDRLTRIWTPYRMQYIANKPNPEGGSGDPFLDIPTMSDEDGLIIARGALVYVVLNLFPYNPGHSMVIPYRKVADLENLTDAEAAELMSHTQHLIRVIKAVSQPHAFNVGFNLGRGAGGSVTDHLHQHVVPRWIGDANFITVTGETKVLPQLLRDTRALLAQAWHSTPGAPQHQVAAHT